MSVILVVLLGGQLEKQKIPTPRMLNDWKSLLTEPHSSLSPNCNLIGPRNNIAAKLKNPFVSLAVLGSMGTFMKVWGRM